jgi:hypothetical protein
MCEFGNRERRHADGGPRGTADIHTLAIRLYSALIFK